MQLFDLKSILLRALCLAVLGGPAGRAVASGPAFLVSVSNSSPPLSELLEVATAPFGSNVITSTNAGRVSTNAAPWSGMAFGPGGALYGITLAGGLAAIDPDTAASAVFADLHWAAGASGAESSVSGAGLALSTNGTAYVSDGYHLFTANLASGLCSDVGIYSQPELLALAQAPNGTMFGLFLGLYTVNLTNAQVTQIGPSFPFGGGNHPVFARSAAFGSDGQLYMVGWDNTPANHPKLYQVNTNTGAVANLGNLPFGAYGLVALNPATPGAPSVVIPPASQTLMAGGNAAFSVTGRGTPAPEIQWYFGGAACPGATHSTLAFTNVSPTNAGNYFVVLSNTNGTATSAVCTLTVTAPILAGTGPFVFSGAATNSILALTTNPPEQSVLLNSNHFFACLSYGPKGELFAAGEQYKPIGSSNSFQSQIVGIEGADTLYSINTQTWTATFIGDFQIDGYYGTPNPIGMAFSPSGVLYAAFGGNLYTINTANAHATSVGAFPANAAIGGIAFAPNGALYGGETNLYTINPANASLTNIGPLNGVSASILADMKYGADGFLYFVDGTSGGNLYRLNPSNALVSVAANYSSALSALAFVPIPAVIVAQPANQTVTNGATAGFAVSATGTAPLDYQWFFDKAAIRGKTNSALTLANALAGNNGSYYAVVSNSLGPVTSSVVTLTTYTPPAITSAPKSKVLTPGQTLALSVTATGTALGYQWQLEGTNLPGKTAASLTIPDAGTNNAGTYSILVSSPFAATPLSASATVAVIPLTPAISSPANYSVSGVSNVTVTGSEPAHGGAGAILFQLNGGAAQSAQVSTNGLKWSAPVTLAPGTNIFWVRATNNSGASPVVKAQYVLNPFIPAAGSYCGLFTSGAAITNAGFFNLTLQNSRTFTGYILLAGAKAPFAGQFDTNGAAAAVASNAPGRVYRLALQLDLSGINPMSGSISNTTQGWTGSLSAVRAAYGAALPATHYEGNYVLAINNGDGNPALAPPGSSYALAGISATGVVTLNNATMADGTTLTPVTGTGISQDGDWPLYGSLNSGKGAVLAWVKFPARSAPSRMTSGQALWFESAGTGSRSYTNGFSLPTNQLNLIVNSYAAPSRGVAVLPDTNYTVAFFGGNLPANLTNTVTISTNNAVIVAGSNPNKLSLTLNAATGTFTGSFVSPVTNGTTSLKGVLLPYDNAGFGYFLGTNQGGGIIIRP
jgi:hypothetical protein